MTLARDFNPAEMLKNQEEVLDCLSEAFRDEDPMLFIIILGDIVKKEGFAVVAEKSGLTRESLYKSFNGKVQPKWDTVHRVLTALDIGIEVVAVRAA